MALYSNSKEFYERWWADNSPQDKTLQKYFTKEKSENINAFVSAASCQL